MSETASAMIDDLSLEPETLGSEIKDKPTPDLDNRMTLIDLTDIKKMSKGEIEYKAKVIESNDNGFKDEFVLILISLPILILGYSIFTDDPEIRNKLDIFFEYFSNLPYWYQAIFIGVVSAIYGLKGADIMRKK